MTVIYSRETGGNLAFTCSSDADHGYIMMFGHRRLPVRIDGIISSGQFIVRKRLVCQLGSGHYTAHVVTWDDQDGQLSTVTYEIHIEP